MRNVDIEISGFSELSKKLDRLPQMVKKEELLKTLEKVAQPFVRSAVSQAPKSKKAHWQGGNRKKELIQPGRLKRSIGTIVGKRGSAVLNAVLYVGPRSKGIENDGWYGGIVHGGHNVYKKGFKRQHVKGSSKVNSGGAKSYVPPNPFMDRAYEMNKATGTRKAEREVKDYIDKQIKRLSSV